MFLYRHHPKLFNRHFPDLTGPKSTQLLIATCQYKNFSEKISYKSSQTYLAIKRHSGIVKDGPMNIINTLINNLMMKSNFITLYTPYFRHRDRKYRLLMCGATKEIPETKFSNVYCSMQERQIIKIGTRVSQYF